MAFQSVPETAEIVINYTGAFKPMVNVINARLIGGYNLTDLTVLATQVDADVAAFWLPQQDDDFNYVSVTVRGLEFENDQEVTVNFSAGPGQIIGQAQPGNVTLSAKKSSGQTGRSARGRLFWIGAPTEKLKANKNLFSDAYILLVQAAVEGVRNGINATTWNAVIVSRFNNKVKRPFGVTFNWTSTVVLNDTVDSMRSRLAK